MTEDGERRTEELAIRSLFSVLRLLISVPCRPGGDLLSQVLRHSTIGAKAFDGRVRDGIGSNRLAKATRPARDGDRRTDDGGQRTDECPLSVFRLLSSAKQNWLSKAGERR